MWHNYICKCQIDSDVIVIDGSSLTTIQGWEPDLVYYVGFLAQFRDNRQFED